MFATAYHRTVIFECDAEVSEDAEVLAAQQQRLMASLPARRRPHAGVHRTRDVSRAVQGNLRADAHGARPQGEVEAGAEPRAASSARNSSPSCATARGPPTPARPMHCNGRWITRPRSSAADGGRAPRSCGCSSCWPRPGTAWCARSSSRPGHRRSARPASSACSSAASSIFAHRLGSLPAGWARHARASAAQGRRALGSAHGGV